MSTPSRANFYFGAGYMTWNGGTFRLGKGGISAKLVKEGRDVETSEFGIIDRVATNKMIRITGSLWSAWENLTLLFPSGILNPVVGSALFGTGADLPMVINGQNGDRLTITAVQLTKLHNLRLSPDADIFSGEFEFIGLLGIAAVPTDAAAYYSWSTGNSYAPPAFAKTNFKAPAVTAAWGSKTGFSAFIGRKGWDIEWDLRLSDEMTKTTTFGTLDYVIEGFTAKAKCLPMGPTIAQMNTEAFFDQNLGTLESGNAADLVISGNSVSVTIKNAIIEDPHAIQFDREKDRIGEVTWASTVGFSGGNRVASAAVS